MNAEKCFHELYFITICNYVDDYFLVRAFLKNQDRNGNISRNKKETG